MKKTLHLALLLSCAITFAGCSGNTHQEVPDAELVGTLWNLESIEVPGEPDVTPGGKWTYPIQFFEDNRIEGGIACNHLDGEYMLTTGDSMQVNIQFITEIGCGESDKSIAKRLLGDFRAVHSYEIIGNQLRLYFNDSVLKYRNVE